MPKFQQRVRRTRRGDFELRLPEPERAVLRSLPEQLRELLAADDPALERLFPPAYPDDVLLNDEYEHLVRGDLQRQKLSSAQVMEETIEAERLNEEQLVSWLGALNDFRLVLGTKLDVTEEPVNELDDDDPDTPRLALYYYLGWLQEQVVEALAAGLDPAGSG